MHCLLTPEFNSCIQPFPHLLPPYLKMCHPSTYFLFSLSIPAWFSPSGISYILPIYLVFCLLSLECHQGRDFVFLTVGSPSPAHGRCSQQIVAECMNAFTSSDPDPFWVWLLLCPFMPFAHSCVCPSLHPPIPLLFIYLFVHVFLPLTDIC